MSATHDHHDHAHPHDHDHGGHDHGAHGHVSASTPTRRLALALSLTATFMVVEVIAGWLTGSLALLSDAGHMLTDAGALVLALFAQRIAARERSTKHTFGYRRAEVLAALANGVVLGASSLWIIAEAIRRVRDPEPVQGLPMLIVAAIGLALNLVSAAILAGGTEGNANVRAAAAHVAADALGSVAAIAAGVLIWAFRWNLADPLISIAISLLILKSAWTLIREAVDVLMEGTPRSVDVRKIESVIAKTPGVSSFHDLHVWQLTDGLPMVSVHVVLEGTHHGTTVAAAVAEAIRNTHAIDHVTVQPEARPPDQVLVQLGGLTKHA